MDIELIKSHIDKNRKVYLEKLKSLIKQPSVSSDKTETYKCAELLKDIMLEMGINTKLYKTEGAPVVFGEVNTCNPNAFTILFYGHYDVQPPDPIEKWISSPFDPVVRNGRLYGRGSGDNKGQLLAHVFAVASYLENYKSVPINIKLLFEGEEEIGSTNLPEFVENNKELLKADIVYVSDASLHESGAPIITFGNRGVMNLEISLTTAFTDNHSGNKGGVIKNAAWEMVNILSTMKNEKDEVLIKGFYDDVMPMSSYDLELIEKLDFNPIKIAEIFGVEEINLDKVEFFKKLTLEPTLTINGMSSGHTGMGTKNIIPGSAIAKIDIRLVPNQDPDDIFEKVQKHFKKHNVKAVIKREDTDILPSRTNSNTPACKIITNAIRAAYGQEPIIMPSIGGSLPNYIWTNILGVPTISVPYANADEANHAPNENIKLDCFYSGIRATTYVIHKLGQMNQK